MHLFILDEVGGIHQVFVDGYTANVIDVGLRDPCTVNL